MSSRLVATALAAAACLAAAPACAAAESQSEIVRFRDLDLARPSDEQALRLRLETALAHVCGDGLSRDLTERAQVRACRAQAMELAGPRLARAVTEAREAQRYARAGAAAAASR